MTDAKVSVPLAGVLELVGLPGVHEEMYEACKHGKWDALRAILSALRAKTPRSMQSAVLRALFNTVSTGHSMTCFHQLVWWGDTSDEAMGLVQQFAAVMDTSVRKQVADGEGHQETARDIAVRRGHKAMLELVDMLEDTRPVVVIPDIHGNADTLRAVLHRASDILGAETRFVLVTLGDYWDNGPDCCGVVDELIKIRDGKYPQVAEFCPIIGNHDMAGLAASGLCPEMGWLEDKDWWFEKWNWYANPHPRDECYTYRQYGATTQAEWAQRLGEDKPEHLQFLRQLPWYKQIGSFLFVHAGLYPEQVVPKSEQLCQLDTRDVSKCQSTRRQLPDQVQFKKRDWKAPDGTDFERLSDPEWGAVVVTGHNKFDGHEGENWIASNRVALHSCACADGALHCFIIRNRFLLNNGLDLESGAGSFVRVDIGDSPDGAVHFFTVPGHGGKFYDE
eukprot:Hpha_TRINITY_DN31465_c0_g1::TRINITY_DN31465_c0_g1_i1::g.145374::m.145374